MDLASRLPKVWRKLYRAKEAVAMPWVKQPALMSQQEMPTVVRTVVPMVMRALLMKLQMFQMMQPALMPLQVMRTGMRKQTDLALPGLKAQPMAKQVKKALVLKTPREKRVFLKTHQAKRAVLRVNLVTKLAMM
jgi:hypothetical protein